MKRPTLTSLVFGLALVACDGRFVDLDLEQESGASSGGTVSDNHETGGVSSGGATAAGGKVSDPDPSGGRPTQLTRGGFGGSMATFRDRNMGGGSFDESCDSGGETFFVFNAEECLAASACLNACDPESPTLPDISYQPDNEDEPLSQVVSECRTIQASQGGRQGQSFLVFPCDENGRCPKGLLCVESELGLSCFVRDIPWAAGCTEAYCIQGDGFRPPKGEPEVCNEDAPCCAGQSCSPDGTCEPLECGADGHHCDEASAEAPCCDGLVCKGGTCSRP
jgi:hypothetical protein